MPRYRYKAIDSKGRTSSGTSDARSREALAVLLEEQGLFLMEARPVFGEEEKKPAPRQPQEEKQPEKQEEGRQAGAGDTVSLKEVAVFTSQLAVMLRTALPILESLDMLARQSANPVFRSIISQVGRAVRSGQPLSKCFGRYPRVFDDVYVSLLSAGEASGRLDIMLDRLAAYLDFRLQLKEKVRAALIYPSIVVLTATAVVGFMVVFVLPTFMEVFTQFDIALPLPTRALIFVSGVIRDRWYLLLGAGLAAAWYAGSWASDKENSRALDALKLRVPIAGRMTRNIVMTRVLRTLASLTESGIPILKSLEISRAAAGNAVFEELLDEVMKDVREGRGISPALARSALVPPTVAGMVATGEKTGNLPEVVNKVAGFYEAETDTAIKELFSAIEPIFVVGLALLVGGIAVSVLLPMFDLASGIQ
jgi:type IV pilus assembly protein PilC